MKQRNNYGSMASRKPARIWLGTIPYSTEYDLSGRLNSDIIAYSKGQREIGGESGYEHWQLIIHLKKPARLSALKKIFGDKCHWEPTRSERAEEYVWKSDTAVPNTQFQHGRRPVRRDCAADWDQVVADAKDGRLDNIPSDILVRCYSNLRRIASDNLKPNPIDRRCIVYWGATGTGKSHRAWTEASMEAYPKDPRTKFWDGYRDHENVVIDEFRGGIDISHMLRWLDRYPVVVEIKGSATTLKAKTIWITSNMDPRDWYKDIDEETKAALLRRLEITYFPKMLNCMK